MQEIPQIEELEGEACSRLRPLWEEVFWEDSREFTDYYFKEKASGNHAFTLKMGEEDAAMLYLSPYPMEIRIGNDFAEREICYIVGVATKKKYRHRGYMDRLLRAALSYMREKERPFAFLMPANPDIYRPYQFTYIYDRKKYMLREKAKIRPLEKEESKMLAEYASSYLKKEYDVFIRRDAAYFQGMEEELNAQKGGIYIQYGERGCVEGYFFYTDEEGEEEIQEAVFSNRLENCPVYATERKQPVIMARIVDVQAMLSLLRTVTEEVFWSVRIKDTVLPQNDGVWKCRTGPDGASVCREESDFSESGSKNTFSGSAVAECAASVEGLAAWIFGYRKTEECFVFSDSADREAVLKKLKEIKKLAKVFINEIV